MMFVLTKGPSEITYYLDRDYWTLVGIIIMAAGTVLGLLQKLLFYEVEERIIFVLRK